MASEEYLTSRECFEVLRAVRNRNWNDLAESSAARKLAPLATREFMGGESWDEAIVEQKATAIQELCKKTISVDLKAPEDQDTPDSLTYRFLKYYYIDRTNHDGVKHRLGILSDGTYKDRVRDPAFEKVAITWNRMLRALSTRSRTDMVRDRDEDAADDEQEARVAEPYRFQSLIEDKTDGFVSREYVYDAIDAFLSRHENGYFIVQGDPGIGKSAILAEYVRTHRCIAHFNVRSQGITGANQFLEGVCAQIINRYDLPYDSVPAESTSDGAFLARLLDEASGVVSVSDPLVIAVDALDEVEVSTQDTSANLLYLPPSLPDGVFFLLTTRPVTLPLTLTAPQQTFDLNAHKEEGLVDARKYIELSSAHEGLRGWIERQQLERGEFTDLLSEKSEGNFMYLKHVLSDIRDGLYKDIEIENLPRGLEGYYEDHWRRMGMTARPLPRARLKLVYVLAELRRPVSRQLVSNIVKEDHIAVQEVLDDWWQFLHRQVTDGETHFSLYHTSFRDFLHRIDIVQATGLTIPEINAAIADNLWQGLFDDG